MFSASIRRVDTRTRWQLAVLDDWVTKLSAKYPTVGYMARPGSDSSGGAGDSVQNAESDQGCAGDGAKPGGQEGAATLPAVTGTR